MSARPIPLDPDLLERVHRAAQREVRSPEFLLRDAVELYFSVHGETSSFSAGREEPVGELHTPQPATSERSLLQQVDESLNHFRRTGLHVTWDEADAWLAALADGKKVPPPECHT